ncbi:MAG: Pr6Pr family membrane protein [Jatrophihabitantaceae bacterium]
MLSFFTIESNILCGVVAVQLARTPDRDGAAWRAVRLASLFAITVTGVVYSTVLAAVHEPHGWRETVSNALLHYVVPLAVVVGWLAFGPRPRVTGRVVVRAMLFPVVWLGYTLIRVAAAKWYPYPFLDVATHGYARVVGNAVAVTAVFAGVAALLWFGDRKLPVAR